MEETTAITATTRLQQKRMKINTKRPTKRQEYLLRNHFKCKSKTTSAITDHVNDDCNIVARNNRNQKRPVNDLGEKRNAEPMIEDNYAERKIERSPNDEGSSFEERNKKEDNRKEEESEDDKTRIDDRKEEEK